MRRMGFVGYVRRIDGSAVKVLHIQGPCNYEILKNLNLKP